MTSGAVLHGAELSVWDETWAVPVQVLPADLWF